MTNLVLGIPTRGNDISRATVNLILELMSNKEYNLGIVFGISAVSAKLSVEAVWDKLPQVIDNFDYFIQMDTDIGVPKGAIDSMIAKDKDVVVAPIWHYDSIGRDIHLNIHQDSLTSRQYLLVNKGCQKIFSSSLGFAVMKNKVVRKFLETKENPVEWSPLIGERTPGLNEHNDNIFFMKCAKLGIEVWVDWDVKNVVHYRNIELSTEVLNQFVDRVLQSHRGSNADRISR